MNATARLAALTVLLSLPVCTPLGASPIIREPGAIYFSDFDEKPLQMKLKRAAPCFFDIGMTRSAGTLRFPQIVKVEAVSDFGCRVRGNAQQGGVAAWVAYEDFDSIPPNFLSTMKGAEERRLQVEALIAANDVALGMTIDETRRSLGKPQKISKSSNREGSQQIWEFVKYELVPQTTYTSGYSQNTVVTDTKKGLEKVVVQSGPGLVASTVYVKVPVGTMKVTFEKGIVEAIDQSEGTLEPSQVSVVVPPVNVYW